MNKLFRLLFLVSLVFTSSIPSTYSSPISDSPKYQCPMKCEGEKTYEKPGKCSVCGMDLEKLEESSASGSISDKVKVVGAMMNVMHKGELFATINLDTISNRQHLFGLGPIEYLKGEILVVDGKSYMTKVADDNSIKIEETYNVKAPFFVYENVDQWNEISLPDTIQSISQLESFLDITTKTHSRPFAFKVTAKMDEYEIHIVNLPDGKEVHSPEDAHENQKSYKYNNEGAELIGFFSTEHKGIFTHHDSFVHIHLLTLDKKKMGHLEKMTIRKGTARLYLPAE